MSGLRTRQDGDEIVVYDPETGDWIKSDEIEDLAERQ